MLLLTSRLQQRVNIPYTLSNFKMSGRKEWPELVGQTFQQASQAILAFDRSKKIFSNSN